LADSLGNANQRTFASAVPEPASLGLLLAGGTMLLARRRGKKA